MKVKYIIILHLFIIDVTITNYLESCPFIRVFILTIAVICGLWLQHFCTQKTKTEITLLML